MNSQKSKEKSKASKGKHQHRSPDKHDLRSRIRNKHKKNERHSSAQVIENHVEPVEIPPKDTETIVVTQSTESTETEQMVDATVEQPANSRADLEEGEIDDDSNDMGKHLISISNEPSNADALSVIEEKLKVNEQNVTIEAEDIKIDVDNLIVPESIDVRIVATEAVQNACTNATVLNENDRLPEKEEQLHEQPQQLSSDMAYSAAETNEYETMPANAIAMDTQSLDDIDANDDSKVKLPIPNECETIQTHDIVENQPKSHFMTSPIVIEQPAIEIDPQPNIENSSQSIESIPQLNGTTNLAESQSMVEPNEDDINATHNNSGCKTVNISTSDKEYLIIENENNEQIIYVTRKKKKKKKKSAD